MGDRIFEGLNDEQREAVETVRGPVAIVAGAGTGKTTTITRRIAWQVASGAFTPSDVLAVTFTTKAAREMASRLAALEVRGVRTVTFHAEALAQFRRSRPDGPEILAHKGQILHGIVQRLPMPHRFVPLRDIAGEIEWAKNRRTHPASYLERLDGHEPPIPPEMMQRVYVTYEDRKRKAGVIDFEDLLEHTIDMLRTDERALGLVRSRYAAFTVDEYQDVNLLQQTLLDLWVGAREDVAVVGDDYQSIFGFTGATPRYLLAFASRYQHAVVVRLERNYRSTPEILTVANRLAPRLGGARKMLRPTASPGPKPQLREFATGGEEVDWIVSEIRRLHGQGTAYEEIAVLFRINGRSEDFEEALARARIPYQVRDGSFLRRAAARAFIARARRATGDADTVADQIVRALGYDPRGKYERGEEATRQADLERLSTLAAEFASGGIEDFLRDLERRFAGEELGRGVQLMTYHRAKGLEFEAVFLPRLEDKELPFALSASVEERAEERRLFYVGITRAKRYLAISYARSRPGERRSKPRPSPFLAEVQPAAPRSAPAPAEPRAPAPPTSAPAPSPLLDALKAWRLRVAKERGLPAYIVFHDSTLAEIASCAPRERAELRAIAGVGALKMQRYGDELLAIIAAGVADAVAERSA